MADNIPVSSTLADVLDNLQADVTILKGLFRQLIEAQTSYIFSIEYFEGVDGLPNRIRALREGMLLSRKHLALRAKITVSALSSYELGTSRPSIEALWGLANAFNVSTDFLLGRPSPTMPAMLTMPTTPITPTTGD